MDTFNIIAGLVTIASLFFSLWIYMEAKSKEKIETEKYNCYIKKLHDYLELIKATANQGGLIAQMADRDETTKKEIKHLCVSMLYNTEAILLALERNLSSSQDWKFGIPGTYLKTIKHDNYDQNDTHQGK